MNINVADLLNGNYILLLFVVLALGLCLGKLRLGSVQLGNSIGVLVVSLLLGQQHFSINTDALNLGFMLFIFCVGVEAGPNFFSIFFRDGKNYLMLALVMVGSALLIALGLGKLFGWDIGLTAGMLAGSMTSTPVLVGAGDTLRHSGIASTQLSSALDNLSLGYALTYLIGLVSLIVGARYLPKLQHQDLQTSAQQIARERGLDTDANRKVYLPVIRAYTLKRYNDALKAVAAMYYHRLEFVDNFNNINDVFFKFGLNITDERIPEVQAALHDAIGDIMVPVHTGYGSIDLIIPGVHKANGLRLLQQRWGIHDSEVVVFGDGGNDIEMLRQAGFSFAMSHASEAVAAAAKYRAGSNNQEGVLDIIDSVLNNEPPFNV